MNLSGLKTFFSEVPPEQILSLLTRFYEVQKADLLVGFFFEGKEPQSLALGQLRFLYRAVGIDLPSGLQGTFRPPHSAHMALAPILKGHFDRRLVLLRQVLEESGLHPDAIDLWIDFEARFRSVVQSA